VEIVRTAFSVIDSVAVTLLLVTEVAVMVAVVLADMLLGPL
jgi:hypothetical protein